MGAQLIAGVRGKDLDAARYRWQIGSRIRQGLHPGLLIGGNGEHAGGVPRESRRFGSAASLLDRPAALHASWSRRPDRAAPDNKSPFLPLHLACAAARENRYRV